MNNDPNQQFGPVTKVAVNNNENNPKHSYRMILITLIVLLVAVGGIVIARSESLQQIIKNTAPTGAPQEPATTENITPEVMLETSSIQDPELAWMQVVSDQGTQVGVGQTITVYLQASSAGKDVTGYDALIGYDRNVLELESVSSSLEDYTIFQFDRNTHVAVTGIKDFKQKNPVVFDSTNILTMTFKAKQAGTGIITVLPKQGREKTQLVDPEVNVIQPQVASLQLEVQ